jgi:hypothetical protein
LKQFLRNIFFPPGPIFTLALIGLMLLGGFLYYKAIRFQRFLEPALALTLPGSLFDLDVRERLKEEFGPEYVHDIRYALGTIQIRKSVLMGEAHSGMGPSIYKKLGRVFKDVLEDPELRGDIKVILVSSMAKVSDDPVLSRNNKDSRQEAQDRAGGVLNALYASEPELETTYGLFFEATAMPVYSQRIDTDWVNFRIIPSEKLHIEVLQKLEKYID